ncbi:MAG TPA: helix-turn-helix transcriptional regulator [Thermoanaerobaculia bacterium]|jgi:transcriptional regulator with XRE-family HTH domain|nr:helix-turn-helix transcriptional regulator [Thermoanaerobaculia bacterium]
MEERQEIAETMGRRIARLRRKKKMSQRDLAARLGFKPAFIGRVERGEKTVTIDHLLVIANTLEVTLDYLVYGGDDARLKLRLIFLQDLPQEGRDKLVEFLDALLQAYRVITRLPRSA